MAFFSVSLGYLGCLGLIQDLIFGGRVVIVAKRQIPAYMSNQLKLEHASARKFDAVADDERVISNGTFAGAWRARRERSDNFRQELPAAQPNLAVPFLFLFGLARRQFWLILSVTLLATVLTGALVMMLKNQYTATALLILDQRTTRLLDPNATNMLAADGEVEILKSDNVALRVVKKLGLDSAPEFRPQPGPLSGLISSIEEFASTWMETILASRWIAGSPVGEGAGQGSHADAQGIARAEMNQDAVTTALRRLKANVTIRRRGLSDVIAIEVTSSDPQHAALVANAYADTYLEEQVAAKLNGIERAEAALSRRLSEIDGELRRSETQVGLRQIYQENLLRLKAISQQRDTVGPDARVASAALAPDVPSFPNRMAFLMLGTITGLGLAVGAAYLRDASTRRIQTAGEVEAITGAPNLASMPRTRRLTVGKRCKPRDEVIARPTSTYSEAARRLFLTLQSVVNRGPKLGVVLVTSTNPREGKSILALSLARTAAAAGTRVVIVDCNLRNPGLHKLVGVSNKPGFADLLGAEDGERDVLQDDPKTSCKVITSGDFGERSPEILFNAEKVREALRALEAEFDLVILDGPSTGVHAESLSLMNSANVVLFTVREGVTSSKELRSTFRQLCRINGGDLFTVLTFSSTRGAHADIHS